MNSRGYTKDNIHKGNTKIVAGGIDVDGLVRIGDQSVGGDGYVLPSIKGSEGQVLTMNDDNSTSFQDANGITGRVYKNLYTMIDPQVFYPSDLTPVPVYTSGYGSLDLDIDEFPVGATIRLYTEGKFNLPVLSTGGFSFFINDLTFRKDFVVPSSTNSSQTFYHFHLSVQRLTSNEYRFQGSGVVCAGAGSINTMDWGAETIAPPSPLTFFNIKLTWQTANSSYYPITRTFFVDMILDSSLSIEAPPAPTSHLALTNLNAIGGSGFADAGHDLMFLSNASKPINGNYFLPTTDGGVAGGILTTDGAGTTSFQTLTSGVTRAWVNKYAILTNPTFGNPLPIATNLDLTGSGSKNYTDVNFPIGSQLHIQACGTWNVNCTNTCLGQFVLGFSVGGGFSISDIFELIPPVNTLNEVNTGLGYWSVDVNIIRTGATTIRLGKVSVNSRISGTSVINIPVVNSIANDINGATRSIPTFPFDIDLQWIDQSSPSQCFPVSSTYNHNVINANDTLAVTSNPSLDHNTLSNLTTGDPHSQYTKLSGRVGGQILSGGLLPIHNLVLKSHDIGLPNITIKDLNTEFNKNIDLDSNDIINGNDVKSNQISVDTLTSKSGGNIIVNKNVNIGTKSIIDGANNIIDFLGGNMTLLNTSPTNSIAIASQKDVLINAFNEIKISNPPTITKLSITPTTSTLSNDLVELTANNGVSINETTTNMFVAVANNAVTIAKSNDPSPPTEIASFEPTLIELKQDLRIQESIIYVKPNTMPNFFISDTTYIFVGSRNTSNSYTLPDNCKICGLGKNNSSINYNGGSTLFSSVDNNLEVCNITLTSSNNAGKLFDLSNVAQNRTINFTGLQIRNTKNGMLIDGYDLIDFNNCIFTYFETGSLTPIGINISNCSKVQLSSCEFLRWFQEGGTPATSFFNGNMLQFTGILNALNLNGCFFHPQYDQNGIDLSAVSSVIEGTITSNTFIDINLNSPTFQVLVPPIPSIAANYVIESNSIYPNLKSQVTYVLSAVNTTATDLSVNNPNVINHNNLALPLTIQFATIGTNGLITYTKKRSANFMIVATCNLELVAGTNNRIGLGLFVNGSAVPLAYSYVNLSASGTANQKPATLSFTGQANLNDTFQLSVFNATASNNVIVNDINFAGIEI